MYEFCDYLDGKITIDGSTLTSKQGFLSDFTFHFENIQDYKFVWNEKRGKGKIVITVQLPYKSFAQARTFFVNQANLEEAKFLYNLLCEYCAVHKEKLPVNSAVLNMPIEERTTFYFSYYHQTTVVLDTEFIRITRKGKMNAYNHGLFGEKTINIEDITAIQLREPGFWPGYLQFTLRGAIEGTRGVSSATTDENTITFGPSETQYAHVIKTYVEKRLRMKSKNDSNVADTLLAYKKLLDEEIITQEEFDAKKAQLLGL